jgi:hypothetical protein
MSAIIPAKDVAASILKIMEEVAAKHPEEKREKLKAAMFEHLSVAMFKGPVAIKENT